MSSPRAIEIIARGLVRGPLGILACKNLKRGYFYLPGGHVEFCETAAAALKREIREEMGIECAVGPLLLIAEVMFDDRGAPRHEISKMFHVEHFAFPAAVPSLERSIAFQWLSPSQLSSVDLRPACIRRWITEGGGFHVTESGLHPS